MADKFDYDLVVIGAGSGGVACARSYAATGAKVAIIERDRVGGTCVLRGCVPKKLMVYASRVQHTVEDAANGFGWKIDATIQWSTFMQNKHDEMDRLNGIYQNMLNNAGVDVIYGEGRFQDAHTIVAGDKTVTGKNILIATGGHPKRPAGLEQAHTSNEILDIEEIPKTLAVVGGGYIGMEFASIFNLLGSKVHVFLRGDTILRGMEKECTVFLQKQLEQQGIIFHFNSPVKTASAHSITTETETLEDCYVLNATGREPNINGLDLDLVKIETHNGAIQTDQYMQTSLPNVFAVGDVLDDVALTPYAISQGRALTKYFSTGQKTTVSKYNIPTAVFTTPEMATVGLTEEEARKEHDNDIEIFSSEFRSMKHCLPQRNQRTFMKLVVHKETDRVLGVHMVGEDAAEIIQGFAVALNAGVTKKVMDHTIGIHPGSAEEFVTMRQPRE